MAADAAEAAELAADGAVALAAELAVRHGEAAEALGGADAAGWSAEEVGDGNLNLVFRVRGGPGGGSACLKASLPYIRVVPSFALSARRVEFEHAYYRELRGRGCSGTPRVLAYRGDRHALLLEWLEPHAVLRGALVEAAARGEGLEAFPRAAEHLGTFLAEALFRTSDLALPAAEKKALRERFAGNAFMCKVTEDVVFSDPFLPEGEAVFPNSWNAPHVDADVRALRSNAALRARVAALKERFLSSAEALLHGDLHTGSVMVTAGDTRVIDPEFCFVGPAAFDTGVLLGNLFLAALARPAGSPAAASLWEAAAAVWRRFCARFTELWDTPAEARGDAHAAPFLAHGSAARAAAQREYLARLWRDTLGYAACEMIRRVVGIAGVADLESVEDAVTRAARERAALGFAEWIALDAPRPAEVLAAGRHRAAAFAPGSGSPPAASALVLVAKLPAEGASKTRLAAGGVKRAHEFARASLLDVAARLGAPGAAGAADLVLLFAPPTDEARGAFEGLLREGLGDEAAARWRLEPMIDGGDVRDADLGAKLGAALEAARARGASSVAFVGSDCPELPAAEVRDALNEARSGRARLVPAADGGYVLLAVPACARGAFDAVEWSTPRAALSQLAALGRGGTAATVGGVTYTDIDEADDLEALRRRLAAGETSRDDMPRVAAFLGV